MTNIHSASLRLSPCNPARPPARNSLRRHGVIIDAQRHRRVRLASNIYEVRFIASFSDSAHIKA